MPSTGLSLNVFALFQKIVNATATATATTTEILKPLVSKLTLIMVCESQRPSLKCMILLLCIENSRGPIFLVTMYQKCTNLLAYDPRENAGRLIGSV